tara:strand:- start:454 stop:660 length:207 start_codon:yes stop_codon:yes gene_type:complete
MGTTLFVGTETDKAHIPYVAVPEVAMKACHKKHVRAMSPVDRWCLNCGAFKGAFTTKWQRPKVLRVSK